MEFSIKKAACFDDTEEGQRVWFYEVHEDLNYLKAQRISSKLIEKLIEKGIIGYDWKKTNKYHFDQDNFDHLCVGDKQYGNMFGVKFHLTFLRYNVSIFILF